MHVRLQVQRFNPEKDAKPHWQTFFLANVEPTERVLDLLIYVKGHLDGTLTFRHSCAHGVCGSDAMRINHVNRLACKTLVGTLAKPGAQSVEIKIQPLLGLPLVKDLVVDMDPFFLTTIVLSNPTLSTTPSTREGADAKPETEGHHR